jgi:hypothetical protein
MFLEELINVWVLLSARRSFTGSIALRSPLRVPTVRVVYSALQTWAFQVIRTLQPPFNRKRVIDDYVPPCRVRDRTVSVERDRRCVAVHAGGRIEHLDAVGVYETQTWSVILWGNIEMVEEAIAEPARPPLGIGGEVHERGTLGSHRPVVELKAPDGEVGIPVAG